MEYGVSALLGALCLSARFTVAKCSSAIILMLWLLATFASQATAQSITSPSNGCTEANLGTFDFDPLYTDSPNDQLQELSFSDEFAADETLQFVIDATGPNPDTREDTIDAKVLDDTIGVEAVTFPPEVIDAVETRNYAIPGDSNRSFTLSLLQNSDFSEGKIQVSCVPAAQGSITIVKNTNGADGTFSFSGSEQSNAVTINDFDITTSGNTGSSLITPVTGGTYTFTEAENPNYSLDEIRCNTTFTPDLANRSVTFFLDSGQDATCTFTNSELTGSITITKASDFAGDFDFTSDIPGLDAFTLSPDAGSTASTAQITDLAAGAYTVTELTNMDFNITDISCTNGDTGDTSTGSLEINLDPGTDVECTFINAQKTGSISIMKTSDADGTFNFAGGLGVFSVDVTGGTGEREFLDLAASSYTIIELPDSDFTLEDITCTGDIDNGSDVDVPNRTITIDLDPGESIVCTFENLQSRGSITIVKNTDVDGTFSFTGTDPIGSFDLTTSGGTNARIIPDLAAGTYTITERGNPEFDLASISCNDSTTGNTDTGAVTVSLSPAQNLTCTFNNTQKTGSITITKASDVASDFSFTSDIPTLESFILSPAAGTTDSTSPVSGLAAGTYTVTELPNVDFTITDISCDNGDTGSLSTGVLEINLTAGADVECTFNNAQLRSSLTITKVSDVEGTFGFTGDFGSFNLMPRASQPASISFTDQTAGTFTVSETLNTDFDITDISCDNGDSGDTTTGILSVTLAPGSNVICTFTNQQRPGSITIIKQIDNDESVFSFSSNNLGLFSIQTVNQTGSEAFSDLAADTYIVTQAVNEDYGLVRINCVGDADQGSSTSLDNRRATIDLDPNEEIICTFISEDLVDEDRVRHMSMKATKGFAYRRARNMLNAEPDRTNFYRRNPEVLWENNDSVSTKNSKPVRYAMNATGGNVQFDFAASTERTDAITPEKGLQLWVEGHYTKADDGVAGFGTQLDIDSEYGIVHLGADFHVSDNLILGALISFDRANDEINFFDDETQERLFQEVDGTGWMAGPYLSARLSKNLFLNARAALGSSSNNLTIEELVEDDKFDTDRTLGRIALTGNKVFQENWRITPTLSVSYFRESINDYISKTGVAIPSQTLELGRAEFEPELAYRHAFPDGTTIEPQFSVAAIWDFEAPDDIAFSNIPVPNEALRGRFESAVQLNWANGNSARFAASYDGFGAQEYNAYTVEAWVDIPLGRPMRRSNPVAATSEPYIEPVQYKECPDGRRVEMMDECPVVLVDMPPPEPVDFIIYFDFDKSNILPEEMAKIDDAIARTNGLSFKIVILEGNTDRAGSNAYNDALSVRRAVSVRKALVARGIPEELITYDAFGEENPAIQTKDGVPLRANRRTEVRIRFN